MTTLALMLMMQYVISTKAGLVNYVQGNVNVAAGDSVSAGTPITTGPGAFAEVLLNPGSFLRMAENSEVVLDNVELTEVALRILSGAVVVEASEVDANWPLKVTTGNLSVLIVQGGVYKFESGKATVIQGKLETSDSRIPFKKGWSVVSRENVYRSLKTAKGEPVTVLENWSEARSALMLAANQTTYRTFRNANVGLPASYSSWMYVPTFGLWTFMPHYRTRSAYGARNYQSYNDVNVSVGYVEGGSREGGGASSPGGSRTTGFGGSGESSSGGGGTYSPAADRPTYRESIPMKNAPAPGRPPGQ